MSTLQERLDRIRVGFTAQVPEQTLAIMHRATEDLRASGIMARIPRSSDSLPAFELLDGTGQPVRSAELLGDGPLVLSFYRGVW